MSPSTDCSAGRFACMSEMSAYLIIDGATSTEHERHHRRRRRTRLAELDRLLDLVRHYVALRPFESEAREIALRRRRQQIERFEPARLRVRDHVRHEAPPESRPAPFGVDGS